MNHNYKNIKYQISATNLELRTTNTQPYTRLILKKNPSHASMKLLHKKSVKEILPKYLLHVNSDVDKEKLLHEIQQQHFKLKRQFSLKKSLEEKLFQKINSQNQPKVDLKNYSRSNSRKNTMSRTFTSTSSQMHTLAQRSIQNQIKSINNQISTLQIEKQKNDDKIFEIKHTQKYIRFVENYQEKLAFLSELKKVKSNLKNLKLEIRNLKRAHTQKKKLKIQQLLMEGEIQNSIERQNIQLYRYIEEIKGELRNVTSKKANMVMKREKLMRQIEEMKEMHHIPVQVIEEFYRNVETSKKWANYSSLSNSKISSKRYHASQKGTLSMKDEKECEQNSRLNQFSPQKVKYQSNINHIQQEPQQSIDETKQEVQRLAEQRKSIQQLQKKYFQFEENYEQDYDKQDEQQSGQEDEVNYDDQNDFESESEALREEDIKIDMDVRPLERCETSKLDQPEKSNRQTQFMNRSTRGVSF